LLVTGSWEKGGRAWGGGVLACEGEEKVEKGHLKLFDDLSGKRGGGGGGNKGSGPYNLESGFGPLGQREQVWRE